MSLCDRCTNRRPGTRRECRFMNFEHVKEAGRDIDGQPGLIACTGFIEDIERALFNHLDDHLIDTKFSGLIDALIEQQEAELLQEEIAHHREMQDLETEASRRGIDIDDLLDIYAARDEEEPWCDWQDFGDHNADHIDPPRDWPHGISEVPGQYYLDAIALNESLAFMQKGIV